MESRIAPALVSDIISTHSAAPVLRSFLVEIAPVFRPMTCSANGTFVLNLGIGEKELVACPAGCAADTNFLVWGSGEYFVRVIQNSFPETQNTTSRILQSTFFSLSRCHSFRSSGTVKLACVTPLKNEHFHHPEQHGR